MASSAPILTPASSIGDLCATMLCEAEILREEIRNPGKAPRAAGYAQTVIPQILTPSTFSDTATFIWIDLLARNGINTIRDIQRQRARNQTSVTEILYQCPGFGPEELRTLYTFLDQQKCTPEWDLRTTRQKQTDKPAQPATALTLQSSTLDVAAALQREAASRDEDFKRLADQFRKLAPRELARHNIRSVRDMLTPTAAKVMLSDETKAGVARGRLPLLERFLKEQGFTPQWSPTDLRPRAPAIAPPAIQLNDQSTMAIVAAALRQSNPSSPHVSKLAGLLEKSDIGSLAELRAVDGWEKFKRLQAGVFRVGPATEKTLYDFLSARNLAPSRSPQQDAVRSRDASDTSSNTITFTGAWHAEIIGEIALDSTLEQFMKLLRKIPSLSEAGYDAIPDADFTRLENALQKENRQTMSEILKVSYVTIESLPIRPVFKAMFRRTILAVNEALAANQQSSERSV